MYQDEEMVLIKDQGSLQRGSHLSVGFYRVGEWNIFQVEGTS
jgi:hypothetical protein